MLELALYVLEAEPFLVEYVFPAVGEAGEVYLLARSLRYPVPVPGEYVHEGLADGAISGDEDVDVPVAGTLEELAVYEAYGRLDLG